MAPIGAGGMGEVYPHICTLFDIGDQGGAAYMVMEMLEGETLALRIKKKRTAPR